MRLLDDNPTTEDQLGFRATADVISQVITDATTLPLTVGIFGGWGSGKTSLMQMVRQRLHDQNVKTVWFNAWKYDGKEVIWNALLQTIFFEMKTDPDRQGDAHKAFRKRVLTAARELAKYSAKVGTRVIPGGIVREEDVDALLSIWGSSAGDELFAFVNRFEDAFDKLVDEYVSKGGYLVIFIDDLDRCLPENAIQVLEALKLYLDRANCVFIVGAEPAVIEEAIRRRYSDNPALSATEYLEKIVQVPFVVPRVRMKSGLLLASGDELIPEDERPQMEVLVRVATNRNPRRVKRFLNALTISTHQGTTLCSEERFGLAKVLLSRLCFPEFYRRLTTDPGLFKTLSGADSTVWEREGLAELYKDFELRRFLERTRDIMPTRRDVRRWIRVTDVQSLFPEGAEADLESDSPLSGGAASASGGEAK